MTPEKIEQERKAFEEWYASTYLPTPMHGRTFNKYPTGVYCLQHVQDAWQAWQALQVEDASGKVAETIDNIGKRYTERGKFIATGDELRLLQQTADRCKAALEMAAWKHYVRAIRESEPILDAEAHRKRKKQAA